MKKLLILAILLLACSRRVQYTMSESTAFGAAQLASQFGRMGAETREVAILHVLWVPRFEAVAPYGVVLGDGGTSARFKLSCSFSGHRLRVQPESVVVLDGRSVEATGRRYDLRDGNLFVAEVDRRGAVAFRQLHRVERGALQPAQVQDLLAVRRGES
jgi:hypothetical protein